MCHFLELYNQTNYYNYPEDYYLCKNVEIPTKLCMLTKNYVKVRSYCFAQSCDEEKIHYFFGNIYRSDNETKYDIQCVNVVDPTILHFSIGYENFI